MGQTEERDKILIDTGKKAEELINKTMDNLSETVKEIDVKGYKFSVDTDLLDDVDSLEYIERIESQGQTAVVLSLLKHIMGAESFAKLKEHFIAEDAKAHEGQEGYKARMRIEVLSDVYLAIIEKFDPKG